MKIVPTDSKNIELVPTFGGWKNVPPKEEPKDNLMSPSLRQFLWVNFGFDLWEWADDDLRF